MLYDKFIGWMMKILKIKIAIDVFINKNKNKFWRVGIIDQMVNIVMWKMDNKFEFWIMFDTGYV